ncbi:MAG: hypothetical protein RL173_3154 [Fibrobacterota bacterium]|jgi:hydroxyacylglutathione hydrolase
MALEHLIFPSGDLGTNTALFWCGKTREGVLVDPGGEPDEIFDLLLTHGISLRTIVLTHAHVDNLGAIPALREDTSCGVAVHRADWPLWEAIEEQCRELGMPVPELPEIDEEFSEGSRIEFGKEHLEVIHLPGHSPGHCGFIADEISLCLVGDACFASAAGRCDLWLGNEFEQERTLDRIQRLPASWTLLPGHGDAFVPAAVAKARFQRSTNF